MARMFKPRPKPYMLVGGGIRAGKTAMLRGSVDWEKWQKDILTRSLRLDASAVAKDMIESAPDRHRLMGMLGGVAMQNDLGHIMATTITA